MPDTPITTVPLSKFPPCCGTCRWFNRHWSVGQCDNGESPHQSVMWRDTCQHHELSEDER